MKLASLWVFTISLFTVRTAFELTVTIPEFSKSSQAVRLSTMVKSPSMIALMFAFGTPSLQEEPFQVVVVIQLPKTVSV